MLISEVLFVSSLKHGVIFKSKARNSCKGVGVLEAF
jgi:hypothetical protein